VSASCTGTPVSWLRLETFAVAGDRGDPAVAEHVATCGACAACLDQIRAETIVLPPLIAPERPSRWRWLRWVGPAMAAAAAAIVVLVIVRRPGHPDDVATIKGGREVVLDVVRERAGTIRTDVRTFAPGDRWKVVVTCAPGPFVWADVAVVDPHGVDYPLGPAQLSCGNRVAVPGAFAITGRDVNLVCARLDPDVIPRRVVPHPGDPGVACVTLTPE